MARIRPFSGLRYDVSRAGEPARLLAPPYDVVDAAGRDQLAARSPDNCIRVILPEGEGDAKYDVAAREFDALAGRALTRDDEPGYYLYHQRFVSEGRTYVRKGFVCLVELTKFGAGPVLAHERTLAGPREDRLKLMRACRAHLELVFGLFSDPKKDWEAAVEGAAGQPVLDCEFDGVHHSMWRVSDAGACAALTAALEGKSVYIADGHHRYTTMTSYRDELEAAGLGEAARWGMIYLSNLDDEGLVVLPTHRVVHGLDALDFDGLLKNLAAFFDVREMALWEDVASMRRALTEAGVERAAFGLAVPGTNTVQLLTLRADFDPTAAGLGDLPDALQRLDVVLLHELAFEAGLGITKEAQAAKTNLRYDKSSDKALARARGPAGEDQLVCFMNATPIRDVVAACDSGEVMPQKSTFFFPKIPTGLVFRRVDEA